MTNHGCGPLVPNNLRHYLIANRDNVKRRFGHEYDAKSALAKYQHDQSMVVMQFRRKVGFRSNSVREPRLVAQSCDWFFKANLEIEHKGIH